MSDVAYIPEAKLCDICKHESQADVTAEYDVRLLTGQWANVCEIHFQSRTMGALGTGVGQRLIVGPKPPRDVLIRKALEDEDVDALMEAVGDGDPADLF